MVFSSGDLRLWDARYGSGRHVHLVKEAHDLGVMCTEFSPVPVGAVNGMAGLFPSKPLFSTIPAPSSSVPDP